LAETSVAKSRPSVPYGANLLAYWLWSNGLVYRHMIKKAYLLELWTA